MAIDQLPNFAPPPAPRPQAGFPPPAVVLPAAASVLRSSRSKALSVSPRRVIPTPSARSRVVTASSRPALSVSLRRGTPTPSAAASPAATASNRSSSSSPAVTASNRSPVATASLTR
jgi:hypothetical protein